MKNKIEIKIKIIFTLLDIFVFFLNFKNFFFLKKET